MFQHQGVWLPDGEKHFPEWMDKNGQLVDGKGTYQYKKWEACMPHIREWRQAVDVGAHVGFWSIQLAKRFLRVHAFEPVEEYRGCWYKNLLGLEAYGSGERGEQYVVMHSVALGSEPGWVTMVAPQIHGGLDSGGTHVADFVGDTCLTRDCEPMQGRIPVKLLDEFELEDVDFIKIDCEGYEHHVVNGACETILRCKPCVIVEQKPHKLGPNFGIKGTPAVDALKGMGYRVAREIGGDYIMVYA